MSSFEQHFIVKENQTYFRCSFCDTDTLLLFPEKIELFACDCGKIYCREHYDDYYELDNTFVRREPLKMGEKAVLDGVEWKIVGNAVKFNDKNHSDRWVEYAMCDVKSGAFSFLNCSYGNYTWFFEDDKLQIELKEEFPPYVHFEDVSYRKVAPYVAQTSAIIGQFPYDCIASGNFKCCEYISPPDVFSIEVDTRDQSTTVFRGRHFDRSEIAELFGNDTVNYQKQEGVGLAQPFYGGINVLSFVRIALGFVVLLTLLHYGLFNEMRSSTTKIEMMFQTPVSSDNELVSRSFVLNDQTLSHYLKLEANLYLSNEWFEIAATLVNESTGDEREVGLVLEHYSGSGWEEGSDYASTGISNVPPGKYHLKIKTYSNITNEESVSLSVSEASPANWNFMLVLVTTLVMTVFLFIANNQFERMRRGEIDSLFGSSE